MFNVCYNCGLYRVDKQIDPTGPYAICPECGYKHPFRQLPLFIVTGASGAGKSTLCQRLTGAITEAVLLDNDILWREEFNRPIEDYRDFFETWLRVCKNITQSGRPVMLFGAGVGVPTNMEPCLERRYFSTLHYLALVCDDELLADRLRQRPAWRASSHQPFLDSQIEFNRWFKTGAQQLTPPISFIDTTDQSVQDTAEQITKWLHEKLS
jgi:broad-specificity NMP kinase